MVLLAVLLALALLGFTVLALFAATRAGQEHARRAVAVERSRGAARGAPVALLDGWAGTGLTWLAVGAARDTVVESAGVASTVRVRRLSPSVFALAAEASVAGNEAAHPLARRTTQLVALLVPARLALRAAVTSGTGIVGDATTRLDGRDTLPGGWTCELADSTSLPAVALPPPNVVALPAGALLGVAPLVLDDSGAGDADRHVLGEPPATAPATQPRELPSLTAPAIGPRLAPDGRCDMARDDVWGDPVRPSPCGGYLPVLQVHGDLVHPIGRGQGVLVVDGDLVLGGGFEFWGVVLVGGRVIGAPGGAGDRMVGALLVRGGAGAPSDLRGVRVRWSSCVAAAVLRAAGGVRPAAERGWQSGG